MGFSSVDLKNELKNGGFVGLLFTFYLSENFPNFLKEMLKVSRYFSFEVFQVCKHFALDAVDFLKFKRLHNLFSEKENALEILFLFFAGMIMYWFSIIVKNKDFNVVYDTVISRAKKVPNEFIIFAKNKKGEE